METRDDRVLFLMPEDRELQFPAVAALQEYVNTYDARSKNNDVSGGTVRYKLVYDVAIYPKHWELFTTVGLELVIKPRTIDKTLWLRPGKPYDCVVNMQNAKINAFKHTGKHAGTICGILSGVSGRTMPKVRQIKPRSKDARWFRFPVAGNWLQPIVELKDEEVTGVIGPAGPETYLASAMGLAVIEVLGKDDSKIWLAKWASPGYRQCETQEQVERAIVSYLEVAV